MLKLAKEMDELASDIVVCGMVPQRRLPAARCEERLFKELGRSCTEKKRLHTMKGIDFADKKKKLPFGPLSWPTGLPAPGYVPKTNPLNRRWETVSGGDAEFIMKSIASGMLVLPSVAADIMSEGM